MLSLRPVAAVRTGVEDRRFDEDVCRRLRAAGGNATDDAGETQDFPFVGDHAHLRIEDVVLAVQRTQRFALAGKAHGEVSIERVRIEDVHGAAQLDRHQVRHVDQARDGTKPDGAQTILKPIRAGPVLRAAQAAADEMGAGILCTLREIEGKADRAFENAGDGLCLPGLQLAEAGRREVTGDAAHAQAIPAVRGERQMEHRIVQAKCGDGRGADFRIRRQLDHAGVVLAKFEFRRRAQHAFAEDPPDLAGAQGLLRCRDDGPRNGQHPLHSGLGVGGPADDGERLLASRDGTNLKAVGVRVSLGALYPGDGEALKRLRPIDAFFHLEADRRQFSGDRREIGVRIEVFAKPAEGEFHHESPRQG